MFRDTGRFRPTLEVLERRDAPAGNVTSIFENGNLILVGDDQPNQIEIRDFNNDLQVVGVGGTTIDGGAAAVFLGVSKDVRIDLKEGSDVVTITNDAIISRDLIIRGGAGGDTFFGEMGGGVGRDLIFNGGRGITTVGTDNFTVGRRAVLTAKGRITGQVGNGTEINGRLSISSADQVGFILDGALVGGFHAASAGSIGVIFNNMRVAGNVRIRSGPGNNLVHLDNFNHISGNLTIHTDAGDDDISIQAQVGGNAVLKLGTGTDHDVSVIESNILGKLSILSEGGAVDNWTFEESAVLGKTELLAGGGDDEVLFDASTFFGPFTFAGGNGADQVQIAKSLGGNVHMRGITLIHMDKGDDVLVLGNLGAADVTFSANVTLDGGKGDDTLDDQVSFFLLPPNPTVVSF